jgi:hypothetical protein
LPTTLHGEPRKERGAGKGNGLGDSCLVTVLTFVEAVGKVGVVDDGSNNPTLKIDHSVSKSRTLAQFILN